MILGATMVPIAWPHMKDYQRLRVTSVLLQSESVREAVWSNPKKWGFLATKREAATWSSDSGYQLVQSVRAVATGGFLGQGWGEGVYVNRSWLPDRHNDFIFAIIAHQFGLVGCLLVLLCYGLFVAAGTFIASAASDPGARLLAVGIVALIAAQVMINVGMTVGLMPITGMTLPFISKGGSSLLANIVAAALLISVARERPFVLSNKPSQYGREREEQLLFAQEQQSPRTEPRP